VTDLRHELHAMIDKIVDAIETGATGAEWVDQKTSPLGRDRHLRLVRTGKLRGTKDGRRVMVRRADIESYLAKHTVVRVNEAADDEQEVRRIIQAMQRKTA
jgi:excisionase family DNA binding protein